MSVVGHVLVHEAVAVRRMETGLRVEGEWDLVDVQTPIFDCLLIAPTGSREDGQPRGRRKIVRPVLLFEEEARDMSAVDLYAEDRLLVTAPELPRPWGDPALAVWYEVDGDPLPLARPGELVARQANLKRVAD